MPFSKWWSDLKAGSEQKNTENRWLHFFYLLFKYNIFHKNKCYMDVNCLRCSSGLEGYKDHQYWAVEQWNCIPWRDRAIIQHQHLTSLMLLWLQSNPHSNVPTSSVKPFSKSRGCSCSKRGENSLLTTLISEVTADEQVSTNFWTCSVKNSHAIFILLQQRKGCKTNVLMPDGEKMRFVWVSSPSSERPRGPSLCSALLKFLKLAFLENSWVNCLSLPEVSL